MSEHFVSLLPLSVDHVNSREIQIQGIVIRGVAQPVAERSHSVSIVLGIQHAEIVHGLRMARNRFNRPFEPIARFLEN
jgi:hypothetical protein